MIKTAETRMAVHTHTHTLCLVNNNSADIARLIIMGKKEYKM